MFPYQRSIRDKRIHTLMYSSSTTPTSLVALPLTSGGASRTRSRKSEQKGRGTTKVDDGSRGAGFGSGRLALRGEPERYTSGTEWHLSGGEAFCETVNMSLLRQINLMFQVGRQRTKSLRNTFIRNEQNPFFLQFFYVQPPTNQQQLPRARTSTSGPETPQEGTPTPK